MDFNDTSTYGRQTVVKIKIRDIKTPYFTSISRLVLEFLQNRVPKVRVLVPLPRKIPQNIMSCGIFLFFYKI